MKKRVILTALIALIMAKVTGQAPAGLTYQAVIRTAGNELVSNQEVGMRISILQGSAAGAVVFADTQTTVTNANGLVTVEIGAGGAGDDFAAIVWTDGPYFIKTETDPTGGTDYTISLTSQLLTVPYALFANAAGSVAGEFDFEEADPLFTSGSAFGIETGDIEQWNSAFGRGDHAAREYLVTETDPLITENIDLYGAEPGELLQLDGTSWTGFTPGYLTGFNESDPTWTGGGNLTGNIGTTQSVGIGTASPRARLEIAGPVKLTTPEMVADCEANTEGSIYYNKVLRAVCFCNGISWVRLDGSGDCDPGKNPDEPD